MAIREGAWDCPACGRKGVPGSRKHCGGCGVVRGDDVKFYLPDEARVVTDAEEMRRAKAGPDWKCPYCAGDNPSFNAYCSGCGSPADGTEKRATPMTLDQPPPESDSGSGLRRFWACCALIVLLFFAGKKDRYTFHPEDETTFSVFQLGQTVEATVGVGGAVSELKAK